MSNERNEGQRAVCVQRYKGTWSQTRVKWQPLFVNDDGLESLEGGKPLLELVTGSIEM